MNAPWVTQGRSPHGERGLKSWSVSGEQIVQSRSPHGERGLKFYGVVPRPYDAESLSSWRAWIEIVCVRFRVKSPPVALLMESVD